MPRNPVRSPRPSLTPPPGDPPLGSFPVGPFRAPVCPPHPHSRARPEIARGFLFCATASCPPVFPLPSGGT